VTLDPTQRFSDRVETYVRARPTYPPALLDAFEEDMGVGPGGRVADVGSGTGIFTRQLLDRGLEVYAVEPNAAMRSAAESALVGLRGFHSVEGRAEATSLEATSVDVVTAAQAFHWFDVDGAREEWRRILRPQGWVSIVWNDRQTEAGAFAREYEAFVRGWGGEDYRRIRVSWDLSGALRRLFGDSAWTERSAPNVQSLDQEGFEGRLVSSSYLPGPTDPRHEAMLRAAGELFESHAEQGRVALNYVARMYVGRL
jgi:SAM-dependent methyltransferase